MARRLLDGAAMPNALLRVVLPTVVGAATLWVSTAHADVTKPTWCGSDTDRYSGGTPRDAVKEKDERRQVQELVGNLCNPDDEGKQMYKELLAAQKKLSTTLDMTDADWKDATEFATSEGNTLLLVVVDGWQAGSTGLTSTELAAFLVQRGARNALGLDVGASSALVLDGAPVSTPSDGVVRPVANHIAVRYGALPPGQLVGLICLRDIFDCQTTIANATVTLDDGEVDVTGTSGIYDFPTVPPRYACVDVTATGYEPGHKCHQVTSGEETYNSVALFPIGERPDARPASDGGNPEGVDADTNQPPPGGCCDGSSHPDPAIALAVMFLVLTSRRSVRRSHPAVHRRR